jgi:hypothetical protein
MNKDNKIKAVFTKRLIDVLEKLSDNNNYVAFELLYMAEPGANYHNGLFIKKVDIGEDFTFKVTINNGRSDMNYYMKVGKFIRYYFPGIFNDSEILSFSNSYNKTKNGEDVVVAKKIEVKKFEYNPKDPRSTFLSLVTKTYPHGHEEEVLQFLPKLDKDFCGNYYKIIGDNKKPTVMFTSHLDTADREQKETKLFSRIEDGDEIIFTDGSTILGADDKSGVAVMLYMMAHNIPGLYYFFIGEERGGIGSNMLASKFDTIDYLENIKKCISFDRRKTGSVITSQFSGVCCSDEFGTALCNEYNKSGLNLSLDPTGVYTDSASFIDDIAECTNVSVGYNNEHTGRELQNMTFLIKLCEASLKVNWESLPVTRKVGVNKDLVLKYRPLIDDIKKQLFGLDVKVTGFNDTLYIKIDLEYSDIETIYDNLVWLETILNKKKIDTPIIIDDISLKIELK